MSNAALSTLPLWPLAIILASWGFFSWLASHRLGWLWWELPGVIVHELAHLLTALLLGGKPQSISIIPHKLADGSYRLGSVSFHPRWYNGALIALAPLWFTPLVGAALLYWVIPQWQPWHQAVGLVLMGAALRGVLPSRTDWGIALRYPFWLLVATGVTWHYA